MDSRLLHPKLKKSPEESNKTESSQMTLYSGRRVSASSNHHTSSNPEIFVLSRIEDSAPSSVEALKRSNKGLNPSVPVIEMPALSAVVPIEPEILDTTQH